MSPPQPEFVDFYFPFGGKLDPENRWVKLGGLGNARRSCVFPFRRNPKLRQAGSTPKNSSLVPQPSLECWCLRSLYRFGLGGLGNARRSCVCSRSGAIQSSGKPGALQKIAASFRNQVWSVGACDRFGLGGLGNTRRSCVFPSRRNPKLRQAGSTPKNSSLAPQPSLECWCLRPLWITWAREHALLADPTSSPLIGNSWGGGIKEILPRLRSRELPMAIRSTGDRPVVGSIVLCMPRTAPHTML